MKIITINHSELQSGIIRKIENKFKGKKIEILKQGITGLRGSEAPQHFIKIKTNIKTHELQKYFNEHWKFYVPQIQEMEWR